MLLMTKFFIIRNPFCSSIPSPSIVKVSPLLFGKLAFHGEKHVNPSSIKRKCKNKISLEKYKLCE